LLLEIEVRMASPVEGVTAHRDTGGPGTTAAGWNL